MILNNRGEFDILTLLLVLLDVFVAVLTVILGFLGNLFGY